jgi:hypothetical protein
VSRVYVVTGEMPTVVGPSPAALEALQASIKTIVRLLADISATYVFIPYGTQLQFIEDTNNPVGPTDQPCEPQ